MTILKDMQPNGCINWLIVDIIIIPSKKNIRFTILKPCWQNKGKWRSCNVQTQPIVHLGKPRKDRGRKGWEIMKRLNFASWVASKENVNSPSSHRPTLTLYTLGLTSVSCITSCLLIPSLNLALCLRKVLIMVSSQEIHHKWHNKLLTQIIVRRKAN